MKLKNINRGLALGCILIIGTAAYVVKDNMDFKKSKPDIETAITDSVQAMAQSNLGSGDKQEHKWKSFLSEYMTEYSNESDYKFKKSDIMDEINSGYYEAEDYNEVFNANSEVTNVNIKKSGSSGAIVTFDYSLYYEYTGSCPAYLSFDGMSTFDGGMEEYDNYGKPMPDTQISSYGETFDGSAEAYMIEVDGKWKIASMSGRGYEMDVKQLDSDSTAESDNDISESSQSAGENADENNSQAGEGEDLGE